MKKVEARVWETVTLVPASISKRKNGVYEYLEGGYHQCPTNSDIDIHLTVDDKPLKIGDNFIHFSHGTTTINTVDKINEDYILTTTNQRCFVDYCHKMVASSNEEFGLPPIPEEFKEDYVKSQGSINKVMIGLKWQQSCVDAPDGHVWRLHPSEDVPICQFIDRKPLKDNKLINPIVGYTIETKPTSVGIRIGDTDGVYIQRRQPQTASEEQLTTQEIIILQLYDELKSLKGDIKPTGSVILDHIFVDTSLKIINDIMVQISDCEQYLNVGCSPSDEEYNNNAILKLVDIITPPIRHLVQYNNMHATKEIKQFVKKYYINCNN